MESAARVQILDVAVCVLFRGSAFEKGMNLSIPPGCGSIEGQTWLGN